MGFFYTITLKMNIQKKLAKSFQLFQEKKYTEAIKNLDEIIRFQPHNYDAYSNKAIILININKQQDAKICFEKALSISFDKKIANNFVKLLINQADWLNAQRVNDQLINKFGIILDYQKNKALILRGLKKYNQAIEIYKDLIKKNLNDIDLYLSLGFTFNLIEEYEKAIENYKMALELKKDFYPAIYNLGISLNNAEKFDKAIGMLEKSLEINPNNPSALLTLASAQIKTNKFAKGKETIEKVFKIDKNLITDKKVYANAIFQLGLMHMNKNENNEALENLNKVLKIDKNHIEANHHLGILALKTKNFRKVPEFYRYRIRRTLRKYGRFDDFDYPEINHNTSLIVGKEQGIGDELILIRLLEDLSLKVKELVYVCSNKLYKFITNNLKNIKIVCEDEYLDTENKIYNDFTKINLHSIFNYISDPLDKIKKYKNFVVDSHMVKYYENKYRKNNKKLIGIAWMSKNGADDRKKSLKLHDLIPILKMQEKYSYVNLQYGDVAREINQVNKNYETEIKYDDDLDYFDDIYSLAALIKSCDIIITCSGVTAHIAGILGVKTFVLVPIFGGRIWYWHEEDLISSWYPSVSLITQNKSSDWKQPISNLQKYLSEYND